MKNPNDFNDVENLHVQAYNRAITALTLNSEEGAESTRTYFEQFSEDERKRVGILLMAIKADPDGTLKRIQELTREEYN